MTEEQRFTEAFNRVLAADPHTAPGPTAINRALGREDNPGYNAPMNVLNGRMSTLRRRLLLEAGFIQDHVGGRWYRADGGQR